MRFEAKKGALLDALQIAQNAIPAKTTLQILHNFLLKLSGNRLEITATDLDLTVYLGLEVAGSGDGSLVLNARRLLEVVRYLPDLPVLFTVDEYKATIECGPDVCINIAGFDANEYPAISEEEQKASFSLSYKDLCFLVDKTSFAVSNDFATRVNLTGVYWESAEGGLVMVGTDGHRLGKAWITQEGAALPQGIILPPRALQQVLKTASTGVDQVQVTLGQATVRFQCGNVTIYSKLIEGPYPDYQRAIPPEQGNSASLNREELIAKLHLANTMSNAKSRQVKFLFDKKQLVISARNQDVAGDAKASIPAKYPGKAMAIGFNAGYVLEVLRLIHTENVQMKFQSSLGAVLFEPDAPDRNYFFVVMPLRLLENE